MLQTKQQENSFAMNPESQTPSPSSLQASPVDEEQNLHVDEAEEAEEIQDGANGQDDTSSVDSFGSSSDASFSSTPDATANNKGDGSCDSFRQLDYAVKELVQTEADYLQALVELDEGYSIPLTTQTQIDHTIPKTVFAGVHDLHAFHTELAQGIRDCSNDYIRLAQLFSTNAEKMTEVYTKYCSKYLTLVGIVECEQKNKTAFWLAVKECKTKLGHQLPLLAYLLKPVQRILKYHLLFRECWQKCRRAVDESSNGQSKSSISDGVTNDSNTVDSSNVMPKSRLTECVDAFRSVMDDMVLVSTKINQSMCRGQFIKRLRSHLGSQVDQFGNLLLSQSFRMVGRKFPRHLLLFETVLLICKLRRDKPARRHTSLGSSTPGATSSPEPANNQTDPDSIELEKIIYCAKLIFNELPTTTDPLAFSIKPDKQSQIEFTILAPNQSIKSTWCHQIKAQIIAMLKVKVPDHASHLFMNILDPNANADGQPAASRPAAVIAPAKGVQRHSRLRGNRLSPDELVYSDTEESNLSGPGRSSGQRPMRSSSVTPMHFYNNHHRQQCEQVDEDSEHSTYINCPKTLNDHRSKTRPTADQDIVYSSDNQQYSKRVKRKKSAKNKWFKTLSSFSRHGHHDTAATPPRVESEKTPSNTVTNRMIPSRQAPVPPRTKAVAPPLPRRPAPKPPTKSASQQEREQLLSSSAKVAVHQLKLTDPSFNYRMSSPGRSFPPTSSNPSNLSSSSNSSINKSATLNNPPPHYGSPFFDNNNNDSSPQTTPTNSPRHSALSTNDDDSSSPIATPTGNSDRDQPFELMNRQKKIPQRLRDNIDFYEQITALTGKHSKIPRDNDDQQTNSFDGRVKVDDKPPSFSPRPKLRSDKQRPDDFRPINAGSTTTPQNGEQLAEWSNDNSPLKWSPRSLVSREVFEQILTKSTTTTDSQSSTVSRESLMAWLGDCPSMDESSQPSSPVIDKNTKQSSDLLDRLDYLVDSPGSDLTADDLSVRFEHESEKTGSQNGHQHRIGDQKSDNKSVAPTPRPRKNRKLPPPIIPPKPISTRDTPSRSTK